MSKRVKMRNPVPRLASVYAEDAIVGKLQRAADELRIQEAAAEDVASQEEAMARLRAQDREPVSPEEWISNPYYTGGFPVWPAIRDIFIDIVNSKANLIVFRGSAGYGKTSCARLLIMRSAYEIGCYGSPHAAIGDLAPGLPLRVTLIGVDSEMARERLFDPLTGMVRQAGWFTDNFRAQQRLYNQSTGVNYLALTKPGALFPSLRIQPDPTNVDSVIGNDIVAAHLTEINKYDFVEDSKRKHDEPVYDAAMQMFREFIVRFNTRFHHPLEPCVRLILDSSERYEGDFLARITPTLDEYGFKSYVCMKSNWETRPGQNVPPFFMFAKPRKGSQAEVVTDEDRKKVLESQGREIILIPEGTGQQNLKMAQSNPDHFSQNIVGVPTDAIDRFITDPSAIEKCKRARAQWLIENNIPMLGVTAPELFVLSHSQIDWHSMCVTDHHGLTKPRVLPTEPRYAHFDLATTGQDFVGFAVGCFAGMRDGQPLVWYDLVLRIQRDGKEYDFALLRKLIDDLVLHGFSFAQVSFDSWQSFDFGQQLQSKGKIKVGRISLHLTVDGYVAMREALYSNRLLLNCGSILRTELVQLERRFANNKEKVGHRPGGHDDVADAVAGVVWEIEKHAAKMGNVVVRAFTGKKAPVEDQAQVIHRKLMGPEASDAFNRAVQRQTEKILRQKQRKEAREKRREARRIMRTEGPH